MRLPVKVHQIFWVGHYQHYFVVAVAVVAAVVVDDDVVVVVVAAAVESIVATDLLAAVSWSPSYVLKFLAWRSLEQ